MLKVKYVVELVFHFHDYQDMDQLSSLTIIMPFYFVRLIQIRQSRLWVCSQWFQERSQLLISNLHLTLACFQYSHPQTHVEGVGLRADTSQQDRRNWEWISDDVEELRRHSGVSLPRSRWEELQKMMMNNFSVGLSIRLEAGTSDTLLWSKPITDVYVMKVPRIQHSVLLPPSSPLRVHVWV